MKSAFPNEEGLGPTKRELLAAMAMQGLLSNPHIINTRNVGASMWIAERAKINADALLAELAKPQAPTP